MDQFVSEELTPVPGTFDTRPMARGEPGLPTRFTWRGREHQVLAVLRTWKTSGDGQGEVYLRRHWFEIQTTTGLRMTIYCQRQAASAQRTKHRWWVYTLHDERDSSSADGGRQG